MQPHAEYAYAHGKPVLSASIKQKPEDFYVEEILGFEPDGEGEHLWLWVEKTGLTTEDAVRQLSRVSGIKRRDISYAGLKDKQARTKQWISLRVGLRWDTDPATLEGKGIRILKFQRNSRKLRRGSHRGNRFVITLQGASANFGELQERLELIKQHGVPNYFGPQRFGNNGANIQSAISCARSGQWPKDRFQRSMLLSAARSWLFNQTLSERVAACTWDKYCTGDYCILDGSQRGFMPDSADPDIVQRVFTGDIHPAGRLWGKSRDASMTVPEQEPDRVLAEGLILAGVECAWRAFRLPVLEASIGNGATDAPVIEFSLGRGGYATSALRELVNLLEG